MQTYTLLLRVLVAALCGVVIGLERNTRNKDAGIRTHCIISAASAVFMIVSLFGFDDICSISFATKESMTIGSARIASEVISGCGFISAGVILKSHSSVNGLATASGIWATAAIGLCCGCGLLTVGVIYTAIIIAMQIILNTTKIDSASVEEERVIHIQMADSSSAWKIVFDMCEKYGFKTNSTNINRNTNERLTVELCGTQKQKFPIEDAIKICNDNDEIFAIVR